MNPTEPSPFSLSETWWRGIILALSITVLLFSVWCLTHGITTIFMHLYYFPIVLLAYRYRWKGFGLATLLAFAYLGLVIIFDYGQTEIILGAFYRFLVFVGIAAVIAYLSELLAKAQSTMQQSAELRDRYLSLAPAIVLALDRNGAITFLSRHGGDILECIPDDAIGKFWVEQFLPEKERVRVKGVFSQLMAGQVEKNRIVENQVLTCGGAEKIIRWHNTVLHDEKGAISGILGFGEDITEEKWKQDTLNKMQQFQESVITNANVWISVLEPDGTLLVWNDAAEAISGYKKTGVLGKRTIWKQLYPDNEYRKKVTGDIQRIIRKDTFLENFETEIRCADGTKKIIVWNTRGQRDTKGAITSYIAIGRDITEQKKAEEVIRSREEQFSVIFHNQQTGLIMVDAVTHTIVDANVSALSMIGASREDVIGKICHSFVCPAEKGKCPVSDLGQMVDNSERVLIRANGEKIPILKSVNPIKIGGRQFLIESFIDLTERKQMEKQIVESRQLFEDIISFLPDPTFVIDKDGKVLAWNRAIEQLSGVSAGDIIGKGDHEYSLWQYEKRRPILIDLVLHPDQDAGRLDYTGIHWDGRTVTAQTEIVRSGSGHMTSLSLVVSPLIDLQGNISGAIESIRDISRLKEAEAELARINVNLENIIKDRTEALSESERKYRTLFDKTRDALLIIENNKFVDCNAAALQMLGYKTKSELFETHPSKLSPPTQPDGRLSFEKAEEMMALALRDGSHRFEWVHRKVTGEDFWVEVSLTAIPIQDHQIIHTAWRDITDRKKAEASIQASLEEKVILLREVHHRVKNNLQIIISLVNLQMRQTDDPEVKKIMSETQNRVRAMSLVHEKLYRSESLSRIDFADYTRYLATQLLSYYGPDTRKVRLDFVMGKIMVDINTAVPLGLLINEIVSNALKHAFPNGREGTISISGGYTGDLITLVVKDNGIGISADFDWKNTTSLGMRLVNSLIDQIDGTIVLDRSQGTTFTITIKRDPAPS